MADPIDARGLSCPQPVVLANKRIKDLRRGRFEILVDSETSRENISRLAEQLGWRVEAIRTDKDYRLVLSKD